MAPDSSQIKADKKKKDYSFLIAIAINIGLLIICFLIFEPTAKSDDYDMMNVLYGGYNGEFSPFILYSNPIYGYLLVFLMRISPVIPWYFVIQYLFMLWGMIEVTAILLKKTKIPFWLLVFLLSYVYYECFIRITFTKTAGIIIISGYLLLFFLLTDKKLPSLRMIEGVVLILLGNMIRARLFLLISVIFAAGLLVYLICNRKKPVKFLAKKTLTYGILACALLVLTTGSGKLGDTFYNHNEVWEEYIDTNEIRAALYDYGIPDYATFQDDYEELGVSYVDYQMWFSANTRDDPDLLSTEMLVKIRGIANHHQDVAFNEQFKDALRNLGTWLFENTMFYLLLTCCCLAILTRLKAAAYIIPLIFAACLFAYFYLFISGRTQHHVDALIIIAGSFLILFQCNFSKKYMNIVSLIVTILIGCWFGYSFLDELQSSSYYGTRFGAIVSQRKQYKETREQLDLLSDDRTHLYLFNVNDTNTIYPAFTVWEVIPKKYYHNLHRLNMDHIPIHKNTLQDFDVKNPIKEITNSDTIYYYVSIERQEEVNIVWDYIRENYNHDAKKKEVKRTAQGIVYRFYTDDFRIKASNPKEPSRIQYDYQLLRYEEEEIVKIKGYVYEDGEDSFAQNVYLKVQNNRDGSIKYYPVEQTINDELVGTDKYHGKYSAFVQDIPISDDSFSDYELTIMLENSNGVYEIQIQQ